MKEKTKVFFLERKKQRTFGYWTMRCRSRSPAIKSFLVLFFKKEHAFFLVLALVLSACGKYGAPSPPGPASQVIYPKYYPTQ